MIAVSYPPVALPTGRQVLGVGIDVVAVERFSAAMQRTPDLLARLFAPTEQLTPAGLARSAASLAARFAAKESVAKALGVPSGLKWHDCAVQSTPGGRPELKITGTVAKAADAQGISSWRLSLSHDAGIAAAMVLAIG